MRITHAVAMALLFPFSALANHFEVPVIGGVTFSNLSNNHFVTTNPEPDLVINEYIADTKNHTGYLLGVGTVYSIDEYVKQHHVMFNLGLMGYAVNPGEVKGLEIPFVNAGNMDSLNYHFDIMSYSFMFQPKLIYTQFVIQPYAFAGLGYAINRANDYTEHPSNPASTASPTPYGFKSNNTNSFAYELGVGIQYPLPHHQNNLFDYLISLDYRYMNLGRAELAPMQGQLTDQSLKVSPLYTQALTLSLTTQF